MLLFVYGAIAGVFVGGTLSYLYAAKVIAKAQAEVAAVVASVGAAATKL